MNIEFKNPPVAKQGRGLSSEIQEIQKVLMANPGKWALIKKDTYATVASQWRKRPGFEAKASSIGKTNRKSDIYARYVGPAA